MSKTNSITYYGDLDLSYEAWEEWIQRVFEFAEEESIELNHYSIVTESGKGGNVSPIRGLKRRWNNLKNKEEKILGVTFQELLDDYKYAVVDYKVTVSRYRNYATFITNLDYYPVSDEKKVEKILRKNMMMEFGEIYEMDINEYPETYALKMNDTYKTLHVIARMDQ